MKYQQTDRKCTNKFMQCFNDN